MKNHKDQQHGGEKLKFRNWRMRLSHEELVTVK